MRKGRTVCECTIESSQLMKVERVSIATSALKSTLSLLPHEAEERRVELSLGKFIEDSDTASILSLAVPQRSLS